MSDLDQHAKQQSYIADLAAKGVNDGGILACCAIAFGSGRAARDAFNTWRDRQMRDVEADFAKLLTNADAGLARFDDFDADDSGARDHAVDPVERDPALTMAGLAYAAISAPPMPILPTVLFAPAWLVLVAVAAGVTVRGLI